MLKEPHLNVIITILLLIIPVIAWLNNEPFTITLATRIAILGLAGVGLNLALGQGGMVSFGHAAFFGIGGYTMGILASHAQNFDPIMQSPFLLEGTNFMPTIWLVAIVVSGIVAFIIGNLSLRTSGVYFIMVTLAFAQMLYYFTISWTAYGGEDGLSIYVRNSFPGLNTLEPIQFFAICYVILLLVLFFTHTIGKSSFGLALNGTRQNVQRLQAIGIDHNRVKLIAFTISGSITGLAGALYADLNRFISPVMFSWHTSGEIMIFIILGGVARLYGPLMGATLYILIEHFLGGVSEYWQIYLGILLLLVVLFSRSGLIGILTKKVKST